MRRRNRTIRIAEARRWPCVDPAPATPGWASRRATIAGLLAARGHERRRGVVLILVVAVLGILFVSGVALLTTVTFSTKTLDAERIDRENRTAVDAIEREVADLLRQGFLGPNGKPYNPPDIDPSVEVVGPDGEGLMFLPSVDPLGPREVRLPAYGEIPGVHPWVELTEPEEDGVRCGVTLYGNLSFARDKRASVDPYTGEFSNECPPGSGNLCYEDPDYRLPELRLDGIRSVTESWRVMDADGDGIPDSYAIEIPRGALPPEVQRALADRLRDPDYNSVGSGRDPDTLHLALRIVSHGSMVNINARLPVCPGMPDYPHSLVGSLLGYDPSLYAELGARLQTPYLPESEEWMLRNRGGVVVPRSLPTTRMLRDLAEELLLPHSTLTGTPRAGDLLDGSNRRWWRYDGDPDVLGSYDRADPDRQGNSLWRRVMDPVSDIGKYDLNHTLTTVSYDDQLIRSGIGPDPDSAGTPPDDTDWIERLMIGDDGASGLPKRGFFEWDNYPDFLDDLSGSWSGPRDPRLGRLKFSFPYFTDGGGLPTGKTLDTLDPPDRDRLTRTIQDAFFLMLRNYAGIVDFKPDGVFDQLDHEAMSIMAASLTANLLDYADRGDGLTDEPRQVIVRDWRTGKDIARGLNPVTVYGLERQPFITEVYAKVAWGATGAFDPTQFGFAIEVYNPYDTPISLAGYSVADATDESSDPLSFIAPGITVGRISSPVDLSGLVIAPRSFLTLYAAGLQSAASYGITDLSQEIGSPAAPWGLDADSRIQLRRTLAGVAQPIVIDEFDVGNDVGTTGTAATDVAMPAAGTSLELSWERDSTMGGDGRSNWRFVVPRAGETKDGGNTLGATSAYDSASGGDPIRPVHIDFANSGNLRQAFPTTGSMLLLMRHAHLHDPNTGAVPFNRVGGLMALEYNQIDNGRMPVFDTAMKYHIGPSTTTGAMQGLEALPWGQLVFDYFTALPLGPEDPCDPVLPRGNPPVDQDGLRVHGRININTAPWSVLAGLPLLPMGDPGAEGGDIGLFALPADIRNKIEGALYGSPSLPTRYWGSPINPPDRKQPSEIGQELAQAIVAYRDAREIPSPDYAAELEAAGVETFEPRRSPYRLSDAAYMFRRGYGFLTVGELLNVRLQYGPLLPPQPSLWMFSMDGQGVAERGDFVAAVARTVALADWVTTKSHVFTIYGTIRGQYANDPSDPDDSDVVEARERSMLEADRRAIRFQTTVDRLPMLFGADHPARIGSRSIGAYVDLRSR